MKKLKSIIKLIRTIRQDKGYSAKIKSLISYNKYTFTLKSILIYGYSLTVNFGITSTDLKLNEPVKNSFAKADIRLQAFLGILKRLSNFTITKNIAIIKLNIIINKSTKAERKLYIHILDKSLVDYLCLGIEEINTVFFNLLKFPCKFQYVYDYEPSMELEFPIYAEPMIDGIRLKLIAFPNGERAAYTKNYRDYSILFETHLIKMCKVAKKNNSIIEIDGECFYKNWKTTSNLLHYSKITKNKTKIEDIKNKLIFNVFDLVQSNKQLPLITRKKRYLSNFIIKFKELSPTVNLVPHAFIKSKVNLTKAVSRVKKQGYKGLILKDPKAFYKHGEYAGWLCVKDIKSKEVKIVEILKPLNSSNKESLLCIMSSDNNKPVELIVSDIPIKYQHKIDNRSILNNICELEFKDNNSFKLLRIR